MFNKIKEIYSKQLSKINTFEDNNQKNKLYIAECNNKFSIKLDEKIESSQNRIATIRKTIQNTKQ